MIFVFVLQIVTWNDTTFAHEVASSKIANPTILLKMIIIVFSVPALKHLHGVEKAVL
jgi:hypothetical protein